MEKRLCPVSNHFCQSLALSAEDFHLALTFWSLTWKLSNFGLNVFVFTVSSKWLPDAVDVAKAHFSCLRSVKPFLVWSVAYDYIGSGGFASYCEAEHTLYYWADDAGSNILELNNCYFSLVEMSYPLRIMMGWNFLTNPLFRIIVETSNALIWF